MQKNKEAARKKKKSAFQSIWRIFVNQSLTRLESKVFITIT